MHWIKICLIFETQLIFSFFFFFSITKTRNFPSRSQHSTTTHDFKFFPSILKRLQIFDHSVHHKKFYFFQVIFFFFDSSVRHKKASGFFKRLQFFYYSVCHKKSAIRNLRFQFFDYSVHYKKSLISKATASYFLITLCAVRNLWFQKRPQFFYYSVHHKKSFISKRLQFLGNRSCTDITVVGNTRRTRSWITTVGNPLYTTIRR